MRAQIAAGNWKMHLTLPEAQKLSSEVLNMVQDEYNGSAQVILAPAFPLLGAVAHLIKGQKRFALAAQTLHEAEQGAYTGEVSAAMLVSAGVSHVILGHSERRQYFGENNALLALKIAQALRHGLKVIYCVGETLELREAGQTMELVGAQMREGAFGLDAQGFSNLIVAYEPVWAIGTGRTASPEQAQEVHAFIRKLIAAQYGETTAAQTPILYGGSVNAANAAQLFAQPDIDGGLVGGASLKSRDFTEIVKALP